MDLKSKIILIAGPTASGKSNFSLKLAKKINGEVINADSMQVYKQLQVLTARPIKKDIKKIKHHLYGFCDVKKNFSTGEWLKLSIKKIKEIRKKKKVPIIVGGTGLYFKALTDGLVKIPNIPIRLRNKIRIMQNQLGQKKFYKKLLMLDPLIKNKIEKNDIQRSIRAYEIKYYTKKSIINWYKKTKKYISSDQFIKLYIDYPREKLINRINLRVEQMFVNGAIQEVRRFNKLKVKKENSNINIKGIKTFDLLSSGSPFNFNNFKQNKNSVTQTLLNHTDVIIHHKEINDINLFVRRSFSEDLWLWIKDSARFI